MSDRKKVIKGLECCAAMSGDECRKCPYECECRDPNVPPYGMSHLAADALTLLKEQETTGGWISVTDRLPESAGLKVIVCAKTVQESVLQTKAVFVAFLGYGDGKWYTPDVDFMASAKTMNDHVHPVWEITHWMFTPEPPKEEHDEP